LTAFPFEKKLLGKESSKVSCKRPAGKKAAGRTAAKCSKGKLKCRLDKRRKPSSFPPAVPTKKNAVPCSVCGIFESSKEDLELAQDWIQCAMCHGWCHEKCGKAGRIFDDDYFTCARCVRKLKISPR